MSSRVDQKREAREERIAREQEDGSRLQRRRRIALLLGSLVLAVVIVGGLVLISQAGDDGDGTATASGSLDGITEDGVTLGDPDAPVTLVEFADPQCPFCAEYTTDVLPDLIERYVKTGQVKMELRLLTFIGPDSEVLARAAYGAAEQGALWKFTELAYARQGTENSGYADDEFIKSIAEDSGLDAEQLESDSTSAQVDELLAKAQELAQANRVASTPGFLLGPTGGELEALAPQSLDGASFTAPIDEALDAAEGS